MAGAIALLLARFAMHLLPINATGLLLIALALALFIGSNPSALYENYARDNVFGWVSITFCWVAAFTAPFLAAICAPSASRTTSLTK